MKNMESYDNCLQYEMRYFGYEFWKHVSYRINQFQYPQLNKNNKIPHKLRLSHETAMPRMRRGSLEMFK